MYWLFTANVVRGENVTSSDCLRGLADFAGTGELSTTGSITWSDFSELSDLCMLSGKESVGDRP